MIPSCLKVNLDKTKQLAREKSFVKNYKKLEGTDNYYSSRYGESWIILSRMLRERIRRCQWCNKKQRHLSDLAGHHIGCVKFNYDHLLDERVIIIVCDTCHKLLEPYSKINLTQMLPQLYEK